MMGSFLDTVDLDDFEATLRRVVTGARVLAGLWVVLLATVALGRRWGDIAQPGWIVALVLVVIAWASAGVITARRRLDLSTSRMFLVADGAVAVFSLLVPVLAGVGSEPLYGGLPFMVVAVAVVRSVRSAVILAAVMVGAVTIRQGIATDAGLAVSVSQVITYVAAPVIFGWVLGVLRVSDGERREALTRAAESETARVREAERLRISRHLHDSVLQTLALIQRRSDDPQEVTALARTQERALRDWLHSSTPASDASPAAEITRLAAEIEERHRTPIDVVTTGAPLTIGGLEPLVAAAGEAMVNAVVHGGEPIQVFVDQDRARVRVFVRDRGEGFDPDTVSADRRGVRESIRARLDEAGGVARLRSEPGFGTEWFLELDVPGQEVADG